MTTQNPSVATILGSSFSDSLLADSNAEEILIKTPYGDQIVFYLNLPGRRSYALYRHGIPHRLLPHQINYRAQAYALREIGCGALLIVSSVGVLTDDIPLFTPLLLTDILMPDNRLPDGSTCSVFTEPDSDQGHLVIQEGLFSKELAAQLRAIAGKWLSEFTRPVVFGYAGGPRTKTSAENHFFRAIGAHVNSMTLAPEVILANELEIPCVGLVVGHKYSLGESTGVEQNFDISESLEHARQAMENIVTIFLRSATPVCFKNMIHRFGMAKKSG